MKSSTRKTLLLLLALVALVAVVALCACDGGGNGAKLSVTFDGSHKVYVGDNLESLRPHLSVTYTDKDGATVDVTDFTLSGTLAEGKCAVTVSYNGLSQMVTVTVLKKDGMQIRYKVIFQADGKMVGASEYTENNKNIFVPAVPEKIGYTGKWEEYALTTGDVTVNAVYTAKQYTVTLDYVGATDGNTQQTLTVTFDQAIGALPVPTKDGAKFTGWQLNSESVTATTVWKNDGDATLTAQWQVPTQGLKYALNSDGKSYSVTGIGTAKDTSIVISSTYKNLPVTIIGGGAFRWGGSSLTEITIPSSVTSIGSSAFSGCSSLTEITIPFGVTSIGDEAFSWCSSLTEITIPSSVTSIGSSAFEGCSSLTGITIPSSVTSIGVWAFRGCSSLESINVSSDNTKYHSAENCLIETAGKTLIAGCKNSIIPADGSVTSIGDYAFSGCSSLMSITIPSSVTSIGNSAFTDCSSLTEITIPSSVTSIGNWALYGCSSLTEIIIPNGVTSIGDLAFSGCSSLTSITIPSSVTEIDRYAFSDCSSLESINVSSDNTKYHSAGNCLIETAGKTLIAGCKNSIIPADGSVTSIGDGAFSGCISLTKIIIPSNVTSISASVFRDCSSLANVTFADNSQLTSIGSSAFRDCSSLTSIMIPSSVTRIGWEAFRDCSSLETVYWNATACTIANASAVGYNNSIFKNCFKLTAVVIGNNVTTISEYVFAYCSSLTEITIPSSVTSIGYAAFNYCNSLTIYCEAASQPSGWDSMWDFDRTVVWNCKENNLDKNGYMYVVIDGVRYSLKDGIATVVGQPTNIVVVNIPEKVTFSGVEYSVTSIGEDAFYGCGSLTSITIPSSITSIDRCAFWDCSSLAEITIPSGITSIGSRAFSGCSSLTEIVIPSSVTEIDWYAFSDCSSLTEITIPFGVTSIGNRAFENCSKLASVTFADNSQLASIGDYAFAYCSRLTSITIPSSVTSIGHGAFSNCSNLQSINVSPYNTVYHSAGNCLIKTETKTLIAGCKSSVIPIDGSVTEIDCYAFYGCSSLTEITIPSSVTKIEFDAFMDCYRLAKITIPSSATKIGGEAFRGCSSLETVYYKGTAEDWANIRIGDDNSNLTNATRYYYSETEPALNADGTAYDGNYWHYVDGTPTIWIKQ